MHVLQSVSHQTMVYCSKIVTKKLSHRNCSLSKSIFIILIAYLNEISALVFSQKKYMSLIQIWIEKTWFSPQFVDHGAEPLLIDMCLQKVLTLSVFFIS